MAGASTTTTKRKTSNNDKPAKRMKATIKKKGYWKDHSTDYKFIRRTPVASVQGNAVTGNPFSAWYGLNGISNVIGSAEFSALFDQYRIDYVSFKFYLRTSPDAQTAATAFNPRIAWYRDYDDSSAPSNFGEMLERMDTKVAVLRTDRPVTIKFKPNSLNEVYRGVGVTSFTPVWDQWIDMAQNDVLHYGVKVAIDNFTNTNYFVDIFTQVHFSCKGVM